MTKRFEERTRPSTSTAVSGLEKLDTKEARTALYRHRANNAHN